MEDSVVNPGKNCYKTWFHSKVNVFWTDVYLISLAIMYVFFYMYDCMMEVPYFLSQTRVQKVHPKWSQNSIRRTDREPSMVLQQVDKMEYLALLVLFAAPMLILGPASPWQARVQEKGWRKKKKMDRIDKFLGSSQTA